MAAPGIEKGQNLNPNKNHPKEGKHQGERKLGGFEGAQEEIYDKDKLKKGIKKASAKIIDKEGSKDQLIHKEGGDIGEKQKQQSPKKHVSQGKTGEPTVSYKQ